MGVITGGAHTFDYMVEIVSNLDAALLNRLICKYTQG